MTKFTAGQLVRCTNLNGASVLNILSPTKTYTVERDTGSGVHLVGVASPNREGWFYHRFEVVQGQEQVDVKSLKVGDVVTIPIAITGFDYMGQPEGRNGTDTGFFFEFDQTYFGTIERAATPLAVGDVVVPKIATGARPSVKRRIIAIEGEQAWLRNETSGAMTTLPLSSLTRAANADVK